MDLTKYVDFLGRELAVAAEAGGDEAVAVAERLTSTLDSALRLTLLEALSAAADEITRDLAPGSVEVRLRGRDPEFVVSLPPSDEPPGEPADSIMDGPSPYESGTDEGATARINFRLPEPLKAAIEEAASEVGRSVNAWLIRAAQSALRPQARRPATGSGDRPGRQRFTGWVR